MKGIERVKEKVMTGEWKGKMNEERQRQTDRQTSKLDRRKEMRLELESI